ncbi:AraC family transcriptional regulator [Corallococcus sp. M34]|uniref:AraC family transcriptional regulator n=1 Tax=Citreicoccus inhibens TaxID=2849499 RepID=UPI0011C42F1E|nr:AraC family transcriptional regulator [Citreicoccus inhibens]MBU8897422.1 AraC family transcriptional regulator [Citreicoccus inhibens]
MGLAPAELALIEGPPVDSPDAVHVAVERYLELWDEVSRRAPRPLFHLDVARMGGREHFGALGFACAVSPDLDEAFARLGRFCRLCTSAWTWERGQVEDLAALVLAWHTAPQAGDSVAAEHLLMECLHTGQLIAGQPWRPVEVHFTHAGPSDTSAHQAAFGAPVHFGRERNALLVRPEVTQWKLAQADPYFLAFFERQAEALLAKAPRPESLSAHVRRLLVEDFRGGLPSLGSVATRLALSERTLRRRLQDEGTQFQQLVEEVREALARRYLGEARLSVGEVAFLLGFSEPSAFHRAFKRWTGETPVSFRRRQDVSHA